jgi:hypothetical protein
MSTPSRLVSSAISISEIHLTHDQPSVPSTEILRLHACSNTRAGIPLPGPTCRWSWIVSQMVDRGLALPEAASCCWRQ